MSHHISHIFYINLEHRKDKKENIEKELISYFYPFDFERFNAIYHRMGCIGCSLSHIQVLKLAKERKYNNVLILEDDFTFLVSKETLETNLNALFSLPTSFDVCFLSYNLIQSDDDTNDTENTVIGKVREAQTTSGYIVSNHYYDKLIHLWEHYTPLLERTGMHWLYALDQVWKQYQLTDHWVYFKTRIGKQREGWSDIGECYCSPTC